MQQGGGRIFRVYNPKLYNFKAFLLVFMQFSPFFPIFPLILHCFFFLQRLFLLQTNIFCIIYISADVPPYSEFSGEIWQTLFSHVLSLFQIDNCFFNPSPSLFHFLYIWRRGLAYAFVLTIYITLVLLVPIFEFQIWTRLETEWRPFPSK